MVSVPPFLASMMPVEAWSNALTKPVSSVTPSVASRNGPKVRTTAVDCLRIISGPHQRVVVHLHGNGRAGGGHDVPPPHDGPEQRVRLVGEPTELFIADHAIPDSGVVNRATKMISPVVANHPNVRAAIIASGRVFLDPVHEQLSSARRVPSPAHGIRGTCDHSRAPIKRPTRVVQGPIIVVG